MSGASIETTLGLWVSSLRDVKARMRPLFGDVRVASSANQFLDGLLGEERRKTGWMRAEAAGDPGPWRQQAILGRSQWDAEALVAVVRDYVLENLADPDAVLVIDETGFLKQGKTSCGVGRQYTGSAGKITNCLFAGSDGGAEHWAVIASLIETCKLNEIDPEAYLDATITRIVLGHPHSRIDELMPCAYAA